MANFVTVVAEVAISVAFVTEIWLNHLIIGGILEWTVAFVGALYIWTFIGMVS